MKSYHGTDVAPLPEEKDLPRTLKTRELSLSNANLQLLSATFYGASELRGFGGIHTRTTPRLVTHYEVVFFQVQGGSCVVNDRLYPINAYDVRFHRPGDVVYSYKYGDIYALHFALDTDSDTVAVSERLSKIPPLMNASIDADALRALMESMIRARVGGDAVTIKLHLWELLRFLLRRAESFSRTQEGNMRTDAVEEAKNYIKENYATRLSLEDIAGHVFLHPNYFHRLFVRRTQKTPLEYLTEIRLRRVCELLLSTNLSIFEISDCCGFCNPSYLIRVFKKKYGTTPGDFKASNAPPPDALL